MDGVSRSCGRNKEIPHSFWPIGKLVLSDKWARKLNSYVEMTVAGPRQFFTCIKISQAPMAFSICNKILQFIKHCGITYYKSSLCLE